MEQTTESATNDTSSNYGENFRKSVSSVLEEFNKLEFVPQPVKDKVGKTAAKICFAEAICEQKAVTLKHKAKTEWDEHYAERARNVLVNASKFSPRSAKWAEKLLAKIPKQ